MTDKQAVDILLTLERDISGRIHNVITEILRKGYEQNGKAQIEGTIESIRFKTEDIERLFARRG